MSAAAFFGDEAKRRVRETVERLEATSGAEVVVAVRRRSWTYRRSHYLFGFVVALALLSALLFLPQSFDIVTWPLEIAFAFAGGALLCSVAGPIERGLTRRSVMAEQVMRAAKSVFVDLGITRTRQRGGLLVYVSLGERLAQLVPDVGLERLEENDAYREAAAAMQRAVARADFAGFVSALEALQQPLAQTLPRSRDDVNELPDEVA